jgi:hypothetical protein
VLAAGLLVAVTAPGMTHAGADPNAVTTGTAAGTMTQPFALAGEPGLDSWILGATVPAPTTPAGPTTTVGTTAGATTGDPAIVQAGPTGWLSLTQGPDPSNGYAIYNQPVAGAGLTVDFTYADTGGGGLSMFLVDGSQASPAAAAPGDGLGYALSSGPAGAGTALGIVGVGFDETGAYSLPDAANPASGPGLTPEAIAVRGSGDGLQGFPYLAGQTLATTAAVPAGAAIDGVTAAGGGRPVQVVFGATGLLVSMNFGSGWVPVLGPIALPALPSSGLVKVGFAADSSATSSTGGGEHAIRDVVITPAAAPATSPTTVVPTTVARTTVVPTTVARITPTTLAGAHPIRDITPSASRLAKAATPPAALAPVQLSSGASESGALRVDAHGLASAQVSQGTGQVSVSVVTPATAPGGSVNAAITITNTSTSKLTGPMIVIVRPPDGVTLRPGAVLPGGCTAVSPELLNCNVTAAQLPAGGSVDLAIPFLVATTAPAGTALPNGAVIISVSSSSATESPFALALTTTGTPAAATVATVTTTTTVAGAVAATTATTLPGALAFTGARIGTTTDWALLLIGAGVIMVLLSVARRPRRDGVAGPACAASACS